MPQHVVRYLEDAIAALRAAPRCDQHPADDPIAGGALAHLADCDGCAGIAGLAFARVVEIDDSAIGVRLVLSMLPAWALSVLDGLRRRGLCWCHVAASPDGSGTHSPACGEAARLLRALGTLLDDALADGRIAVAPGGHKLVLAVRPRAVTVALSALEEPPS